MWISRLCQSFKSLRSGAQTELPQGRASRRQRATRPLTVESLEGRALLASLTMSDVSLVEGNAGTQYASVVVRLDAATNKPVSVNFGTTNGTAAAGSDYSAVSGKLTFAVGETSKTIQVPVSGDRVGELDETFFVKIHGAKNAKIADATGVITIVDDDPRISIQGDAVTEGNSGTTLLTFTVTLSVALEEAVTVNYATQDSTAVAGEDYLAAFGTLTFAPGETTKTVTVQILGDTTAEPTETFSVNLSDASANASIAPFFYAIGGILDDDGYPGEPCTENCSTE